VQVRHGVIVVGLPAAGKSSVINVVRETITDLAEEQEDLDE
jgi:ribosome biogenesis GTPase A